MIYDYPLGSLVEIPGRLGAGAAPLLWDQRGQVPVFLSNSVPVTSHNAYGVVGIVVASIPRSWQTRPHINLLVSGGITGWTWAEDIIPAGSRGSVR